MKRDVDQLSDRVDDEEEDFYSGEGFIPQTVYSIITVAGGITEPEARDICNTTFNALSYKDDCIALTNIDIEDTVGQCVEDIKVF